MTPKQAGNRKIQVTIPSPEDERPRYGHIGVIALVCFIIGIAWPFAAGVRLVPSAPEDDDLKPPNATPKPQAPVTAAPQAPLPAAAPPPAAPTSEAIEIDRVTVLTCHRKDGSKPPVCDKPDLGDAMTARLKGLVSCDAAVHATGKLSLGLKLDFESNKVVDVVTGKSSTMAKDRSTSMLGCAKQALNGTTLAGVEHRQASYVIFYLLAFSEQESPVPGAATSTEPALIPASGSATVVFDSALVREHADPSSTVVDRVLYGTRVFVSGRIGEWYEIKYDAKGHKGFIHKKAIGMP